MKCWFCGYGGLSYGPHPPVAWLRVIPSGNTIRLCQIDLDYWFDAADDDPDSEPIAWDWLPGGAPVAA